MTNICGMLRWSQLLPLSSSSHVTIYVNGNLLSINENNVCLVMNQQHQQTGTCLLVAAAAASPRCVVVLLFLLCFFAHRWIDEDDYITVCAPRTYALPRAASAADLKSAGCCGIGEEDEEEEEGGIMEP